MSSGRDIAFENVASDTDNGSGKIDMLVKEDILKPIKSSKSESRGKSSKQETITPRLRSMR